MTAPQLLRVGDLLLAGGPLSASDVDAGAIVELVQTTGDQVTVDTNRGKFVFDGDSNVTRKERPDRDEAETPFVPMTVTAAELRVGDMVVAGGGVPTDDTGWGDSSVVQEATANGDQTWMVRTETAEFKVPTESLLTVYHDVPDGTVVVDELDEHQRAVWAGIPEAVQERMTAPEMAGMGYDDEPMPAYRAAFFTNRRGVKVWHDPTTGKFAPTGYVSLRLLRRLWAGDTKAGMEFDDAVRKLRDREPDISYDAAVARLLGGASDRPLDRLYTDAAQRRMRRLWPATTPLDKPMPGPTMRRTDLSGLSLSQRPYRHAPAPTAASVDYLMASRQPALDGYLLGVGDDRFRVLSSGQALDGIRSGFAVDDNTGRFFRWEADRNEMSGTVKVRAGSGAVNVGDNVFYMGDAASPVDTPWRVQQVSAAGTVLLRDESGVRPDTFVDVSRVTPADITFDGPVEAGRVDPDVLAVRVSDTSVDREPTRDSPLVADLVGMNPGTAVQIGDDVYLKESTDDALVSGGFVNVTDLSERLSVGEAVDVIQSSPQSPLESVVDDNEVLEAVAEQLSARPLSPNEARARAVLDRVSGRQIDAVAARVIPMQPLPDTPEMREPGAVEEAAAELSRANPDVNVFVTSAGFGPGLYGTRSVLAADINQSSRDGYWRNGEFRPFTDAARQRADRIAMREADAAALGRGGDGGQTLARQARRRQRLRNQYRRDLDIPSDERPVGTRVKLFGTRYTKQADGSWDGRRYDRETGTRTQSNISADEYDALRVQKREQLDAVQSGQSVDALQVPEAVTDLIDRIRAVTGPVKGSPYRATPMRPGELLNEPGFMPEWEADALTRLVADEPVDAQQIDALNIRESITDLIDRIRAVTGPIKDSPYNATPMRPGELMNEPGTMSEWEAEGIARLKKLGDYPASLSMDDVDLWAEIDFADFDDSSDVGPEARIQIPNSDERRVIDLAMTAGELHRGLPDFDRESRSYTDGPYALSWDAATARWTARRSLGNEDGPFVYGYSDDSAFDAMSDAGFKDSDNAIFDGWLKAENSGVQIDAVSTIFDTPERPMTDSEAQIAANQIGGWTIAAISGGRKSVENGRLVMPAGAGYQVRVSLAPDDTYSVERVFVRGTNVYPKGRIDGVYADQLSNVAYRAALYADGPFKEERRQVDAPPSAMSIDLLIGERRKQPKVGQALLEEPGAIGVVPTEATLEQILDAEQPAISAAFTIDFFDSQDPQMPLTRQFRVLTVRQSLDTTDDRVFDPMRGGKDSPINELTGFAIDDATGDVYRFSYTNSFTASDRHRGGTILTHLVKGEDVDGDGVLEFIDRTGGKPFSPPGAVYAPWPGELYGDADFRLYAASAQSAGVGVTPVGSRRNAAIDADASGRSFAFLMTSSNVDTVAELQQELQAFRPNNPSRQFSGADLKAGAVWFNRERSDITIDDIEAGVPTVEVIVGTNPDRALRHRLTVIAGIQLNDGRFALSGPPSTLYRTNVQQWERGRAGASWRRQVGRSWGLDDVAVVTGQVIGGADNPEGQVVLDPAPAVTIDAVNAEPVAIYEVGGAVRDDLMGIRSDDVDFAVTAPSYEAMKAYLEAEGFRIFQEKEEFVTIKAQVPEGNPLRERTNSADFVLARRDGPSSDGRRPDYTEPGSLEDDLERRDFTVNAIARDVDGNLIDPHGGQADIENRVLRFVGDPEQRVREDGLRVLRGYRFMVTKGLTPEPATWAALTSPESAEMLKSVSKERVASELQKMFDYDTIGAVQLLGSLPDATLDAIFPEGVRLSPNMRKVKGATKDRTIDPLMVDGWLAQRPFVGVDGRPLSWPDVLGRMGTANPDVEVDPPLRVLGVANPRDVERAYTESLRFDEGLVSRAADQLRGDRDVAFDAAYRRSAMDMSIDPVRASRPRPWWDDRQAPDPWAYPLAAMYNPEDSDYVRPQSWSEVEDLEAAGYVVDPDDQRRIDARRPVKFRTETFPVMVDPTGERDDEYPESLSEVEDLRDRGFVEDGGTSIDAVMAPNVYGNRDLVRTRRPSLALNALTGSELVGTVAAMSTADLRVALLSGNLLPQQVSAVREELRLREGEAVAASLF